MTASRRNKASMSEHAAHHAVQEHASESQTINYEPASSVSESLLSPRLHPVQQVTSQWPGVSIDTSPHAFTIDPYASAPVSPDSDSVGSAGSLPPTPPSRRSFLARSRRRNLAHFCIASPSQPSTAGRRSSIGDSRSQDDIFYEENLAPALDYELVPDQATQPSTDEDFSCAWKMTHSNRATSRDHDQAQQRLLADIDPIFASEYLHDSGFDLDDRLVQAMARVSRVHGISAFNGAVSDDSSLDDFLHPLMDSVVKHSQGGMQSTNKKTVKMLESKGAVAVLLYESYIPKQRASDIWPECRDLTKLPPRYSLIDLKKQNQSESKSRQHMPQSHHESLEAHLDGLVGRPQWRLPVEIVEHIASYLNRDDIKCLRLVSRELNHFVSRFMFRTVVVPFNTEIYGMLGQEPKVDFKGKRRAKVEAKGYYWKNASVDELYNGHGLDVFRGFGKHILKFGMSFEVNEASLSNPPSKSLMERKSSFWGNYDWPFEEYRRFDAVAGLETAADETPRMTVAFSELSKVKELALSVDNGLGWLNGPDRSIRARILHRAPSVFGTPKEISDRRAQAHQELWNHIEAYHQSTGSDIKLATLYKMEGSHQMLELKGGNMLAEEQPTLPCVDPTLVSKAIPYDIADIKIPTSFDDPEDLNRFILPPGTSGNGVLFSSLVQPMDAALLMGPIIPANLTKAQKEWLLETEWAQRAFMSSYMLSIIDNPKTFNAVHTLNISKLSDRYISMLNRCDFWASLPNLNHVTLMVDPGWRSVQKDEAGYVDATRINPSQGIDPFVDLLRNHVSRRPRLRNLTIGWVVGGEHAEGLFARNKLIMPAPLIGSSIDPLGNHVPASEMFVDNNSNHLRASLLYFPHVEQLTLKNCWMTPSVLVQLVNIHDSRNLRNLVLDSVSLTAVLRPGNVNQAAPQLPVLPGTGAAPGQGGNLPQAALQAPATAPQIQTQPNQQAMQTAAQAIHAQVQHLQTFQVGLGIQLQNQIASLQNQLQPFMPLIHPQNPHHAIIQPHGQGQMNTQQNAQANWTNLSNLAMQVQQALVSAQIQPPPLSPPANLQSALKTPPRPGSWTNVIDIISPGNNLQDFGSEHSQAQKNRSTALQSIEFRSCGYVKLPHATFDQSAILPNDFMAGHNRNPAFAKRYVTLSPAMLSTKFSFLGEIVQEMTPIELTALDAGWDLRTGWKDADEARAVEFDGLLPGGSGRFSGIIHRSDRLGHSASSTD